MRHRHHCHWDVTNSVFTPPQDREIESEGRSALEIAKTVVYGFTTVSLRCTECGDVDTRVLAGHWLPPAGGIEP